MKVVIALDSYKGTMSARTACAAVQRGLQREDPSIECIQKPMADGGEGTAEAMITACHGEWIEKEVLGPLDHMRVTAGYAWFEEEKTALVEMASASGIILLDNSELNPMKTTTYGTGELMAAAIERGAEKIWLAVGGSATTDGGVGAAMALGWQFLDEDGETVGLGGEGLASIRKIIAPESAGMPAVEVLCDVDNPLTGPSGAATVYGPQKGADPEMVQVLDQSLSNLAGCVKDQLGKEIDDVPGAGAAGGLSAGAIAFMNATLVPGIDTVMEASALEEALKEADWVITGEGKFDHQSLRGKVVSGVAQLAQQYDTQVAVIAGCLRVEEADCNAIGISIARETQKPGHTLEEALACAEESLVDTAEAVAALMKSS